MYKSNNKVYIYLNGQDYVLYDFSADKGDSWETRVYFEHYGMDPESDSIIEITVDSISSLIIEDDTLKTFYTKSNSPWSFEGPIIENIGNRYMFPDIWPILDQNVPYLRCYIDDSIYYSVMKCDTIFETELKLNNSIPDETFLIYANPSNDLIYLKSNNRTFNNIYIELFDMQGKCIFNKRLINYTNEYILNVNNLNKGIYFILIRNENINIHYSKILIK